MLYLLATASWAAGLDAPQVGSVDSGPLTADPAALFYNPALLARIDRPTVMAGAAGVLGRASYQRERRGTYAYDDGLTLVAPSDPADLDASRTGPAEAVGATPIAPLGDLFAAFPAGPAVFGLGAYVPFAAVLDYPERGAQRFALQDTSVIVSHLTAGAALSTGPLSLGVGASYVLGFGELSKTQDLAGLEYFHGVFGDPPIDQPNDFGREAPSTVREQEVFGRDFALHDGISHGVTFHAGLALDLDTWRIAVSYEHGSTVDFRGRFTLDMDAPFFTNDVAPIGLEYPSQVAGDGSFSVATPKRARVGIAHTFPGDVTARLSASLADWSRYDATRLTLVSEGFAQPDLGIDDTVPVLIPRRWQASLGVEAAVRFPRATVALGYQSPASPDATVDAASVDGHRLLARGGANVSLSDTVALWAGGSLQGILPREVTTSDHDLANGRYGLVIGALSAHVTYTAR